MDFDFTDEQRLLRDSVTSFLADNYGFESAAARRSPRSRAGGPRSGRRWRRISACWAPPCPKTLGGLGGGPVDTLVMMEALGRALVVEPYLGDRGDRRRAC